MTVANMMNSKNELLNGFHKHHIIPKHLGGTDDPSNLVLLHPYDHAIVHFVRWKMFNSYGDAWAFNKLKGWLDDGAMTVKGMKHSNLTKQKIGKASTLRIRKPHSEETKAKISKSKLGCSSNRKGAKHTVESIKKMRESNLGKVAWNKGTVGIVKAWNKGLVGQQVSWNKGLVGKTKWTDEAKLKQSKIVKQIWAKRKVEAICQPV